jgi:hypothetical protein
VVADLLESQMLASETAPISYPGVAFEDEVAEPCFTNMGRLVEKARIVGQAYERHRCHPGLNMSMSMSMSTTLPGGTHVSNAAATPQTQTQTPRDSSSTAVNSAGSDGQPGATEVDELKQLQQQDGVGGGGGGGGGEGATAANGTDTSSQVCIMLCCAVLR